MNRAFALTSLSLAALVGGWVLAQAEVPAALLQADGIPTLAPILDAVAPAVVSITVENRPGAAAKSARNRRTSKPAAEPEQLRAGSGVIVDAAQGLIVTNNHVSENADQIAVTLVHGRRLKGTLLGADAGTDLALIKVQPDDLTAIPWSNSDRLRSGDFVVAMGIPYPLGRTVTLGIVSALHRSNVGLAEAEDFIQTDAAIYPGDSGGALVDLRGELVGINTGYIGSTSNNSGVGFAIPTNLVHRVLQEIMAHGAVRRGSLGFSFEDASDRQINDLKLSVPRPVIDEVDPGSAAERAGLKVGDAVTAIEADELHHKLGLVWLGEMVELTLLRGGQPVVVHAVMEAPKGAKSK